MKTLRAILPPTGIVKFYTDAQTGNLRICTRRYVSPEIFISGLPDDERRTAAAVWRCWRWMGAA